MASASDIEAIDVESQLERVLASKTFDKAHRSQRFLRHLVAYSLSNPGSSVKEYTIALEVFDRPPNYNPSIDATVRVEASRLRHRLREYYEEEGRDASVVFSVPKGSYQAVIERRPAPPNEGSVAGDRSPVSAGRPIPLDSAVECVEAGASQAVEAASSGKRIKRSRARWAWTSATAAGVLLIIGFMTALTLRRSLSPKVRLFDSRLERGIWSGRFEDAQGDTSTLQARIVSEITSRVSGFPKPSEQNTQTTSKALDPSAYDGYLQGRYLLSKRDFEGAVKMFRRAVVIDPGYAPSWAGLAAGLAELGLWTDPAEGLIPEARSAAKHAVELDSRNGEAWSVLGEIAYTQEFDWKGAENNLQRAAALRSSDSTIEARYAIFLSTVGLREEAVAHMRRALELDPMSFYNVRLMASVLYWSRRYDESLEYIRKAEEMEPELTTFTSGTEVDDYAMKQMEDQAVMADLRSFSIPDRKLWHDRLSAAYSKGGRKAYWNLRIKAVEAEPLTPCRDVDIGRFYVLAGDKDNALEHLVRALDQGCFYMAMMRTEPIFDPLRNSPRFKELLRRVNLSE